MKSLDKLFLETSFWVRFLVRDDEKKYSNCQALLRSVELGKFLPYSSSIVIMEIVFILIRQYRFGHEKVLEAVARVLRLRNLTLVEKTDTRKALDLFGSYKIKYGDCMISTQVPKGVRLITYDADFSRIKGLIVATPDMVLSLQETP